MPPRRVTLAQVTNRRLPAFEPFTARAAALAAVLTITVAGSAPVLAGQDEPAGAGAKVVQAKPTDAADKGAAAAQPKATSDAGTGNPAAAASAVPAPARPNPARDAAAEAAWESYEKRWSETSSYIAGFRQTIEVPDVGTKVESAGRFYFAKPDKVQWQYTEGPPQTVVGDGEWLWLYQPDLEQVYKIPYGKAFGRGGLVALLAGREGVSERYRATLEKSDDGTVRIRLTPLDKAEGDIEVTLAADTFDLRGVVVHDPAGSVTNMVFSEPVRNRGLDAGLFTFTPPQGVDIITDHEAGF